MLRPGLLTLRKPLPLARSIRWVPVGDPGPPPADDPALFITQGTLREVIRHLRSDPEHELLGFLLGNLFECPETGALYTVITSAMRTGHVITEVEPVQIPEEEWLGMQLELRRRRAVLMGWYHSTPFVAPRPARLDLEKHAQRFPEPFQCGMVVATEGDAPTGGFFRLTSPEPQLAGSFLAFHEVVDDSSILPGGVKRTLVDWANYRTEDAVEPDLTERRPHLRPHRPSTEPPVNGGTAARPANGTPATGGSTGTAGASPLPLMIPSAMTWEDMPDIPPPPPRSRVNLAAAAGVIIIAAAVTGGAWWFTRRASLEPRGAPTDLMPVLRRAPVVAPPTVALPLDTTAQMMPSTDTPAPPPAAAPAAGSSARTQAPPVTPGTAATGAAGTGALPRPAVLPPPTADARLLAFDSLADSLDHAIQNFEDRNTDFTLKRIGCGTLAMGYRAADDAFITLATTYRGARDALDDSREARYEELMKGVEKVNGEFDGSKCDRP